MKSRKALLKHAAFWFADKYGLDVVLRIKKDKRPFFFGETQHVDDNEYRIFVNPDASILDQLITLLHEMWHVKQFEEGRLYATEEKFFWDWHEIDVGYEEQPWEIEAHAVEWTLTELYLAEEW